LITTPFELSFQVTISETGAVEVGAAGGVAAGVEAEKGSESPPPLHALRESIPNASERKLL
jgi:hypothetical protein